MEWIPQEARFVPLERYFPQIDLGASDRESDKNKKWRTRQSTIKCAKAKLADADTKLTTIQDNRKDFERSLFC